MPHKSCRFCDGALSIDLVDLGKTALANSYLADSGHIAEEQTYPLRVKVCEKCFLAQVDEAVDATAIFNHDYAYLSSYSSSWVAHAKSYADAMVDRFQLSKNSLIMEIASNDGYLLQHFHDKAMSVLGVEPAGHAAQVAQAKGIDTRVEFFNETTAKVLKGEGLQADLIAANNVVAHVPAIGDFIAGFQHVLKPTGVLTFEFPHLLNMINQFQFDTIYHEHYSYISLLALGRILAAHNMRAFDVETLPTHGGSLRVFCCHDGAEFSETKTLRSVRENERAAKLDQSAGYAGYAQSVALVRDGLINFVAKAKAEGKTIGAYGAAAKGNTFLNFAKITSEDIPFVVDRSKEKQGKLLPGSHIPIFDPDELKSRKPDYVIILPWNLKQEISKEHEYIREWGGQFVTAVPQISVF